MSFSLRLCEDLLDFVHLLLLFLSELLLLLIQIITVLFGESDFGILELLEEGFLADSLHLLMLMDLLLEIVDFSQILGLLKLMILELLLNIIEALLLQLLTLYFLSTDIQDSCSSIITENKISLILFKMLLQLISVLYHQVIHLRQPCIGAFLMNLQFFVDGFLMLVDSFLLSHDVFFGFGQDSFELLVLNKDLLQSRHASWRCLDDLTACCQVVLMSSVRLDQRRIVCR